MPDLVLLDVMMPGLSGYDVCRRLRADAKTALLPVVLVTSLDPQQERVKGIEAGADDFLSKPINQAELFARVRSLLRIKALQDEVRRQAEALRNGTRSSRSASREQVGELERLGQLKRFFSPPVADAIVAAGENRRSSRRTAARSATSSSTCAASPRSPMPPSRRKCEAVLHDYHAAMGALITAIRGHARPLRRRRHPDLLQRSVSRARARQARGADGAGDAARSCSRCARAGRSSATSSTSASASPRASRRWAPSASKGAATTRRSAASSISRSGCAARRAAARSLIDRRTFAALGDDADVEPVGPLDAQGLSAARARLPAQGPALVAARDGEQGPHASFAWG